MNKLLFLSSLPTTIGHTAAGPDTGRTVVPPPDLPSQCSRWSIVRPGPTFPCKIVRPSQERTTFSVHDLLSARPSQCILLVDCLVNNQRLPEEQEDDPKDVEQMVVIACVVCKRLFWKLVAGRRRGENKKTLARPLRTKWHE